MVSWHSLAQRCGRYIKPETPTQQNFYWWMIKTDPPTGTYWSGIYSRITPRVSTVGWKYKMNSSYAFILANTPALAPPPGITPDFIHPASITRELIIISAICLTLMVFFVIIRVSSKLGTPSLFGWDDCKSFCLEKCFVLIEDRY